MQFIPYPQTDGNTKLRHKEKRINIEMVSYFIEMSNNRASRRVSGAFQQRQLSSSSFLLFLSAPLLEVLALLILLWNGG